MKLNCVCRNRWFAAGTVIMLLFLNIVRMNMSVWAAEGEEDFLQAFTAGYPEMANFLSQEEPASYAMKGLVSTENIYAKGEKKGEIGIARDMTPQGVVVTDQYVMVSAYSKSHQFHSVLWVTDRKSGEYVKTVVLEGKDHVGGIGYDDTYDRIWITCTDGKGNNGAVGYVMVDEIDEYDLKRDRKCLNYDRKYILEGISRTSFLAVDSGYLYSGEFRDKADGTLCVYSLDLRGLPETEKIETKSGAYPAVKPCKTVLIPDEIQGVTLDDGMIVFSRSYGPKDSDIIAYRFSGPDGLSDLKRKEAMVDIDAPPFLEQIFLDGTEFFALFESSAQEYLNRKNVLHIDRVLKFDLTGQSMFA